jgi:hypothetical protein
LKNWFQSKQFGSFFLSSVSLHVFPYSRDSENQE